MRRPISTSRATVASSNARTLPCPGGTGRRSVPPPGAGQREMALSPRRTSSNPPVALRAR
nr:hypothetical protein [Archangium violaceum]